MKRKIGMMIFVVTLAFIIGTQNVEARNYSPYYQSPYMYQIYPIVQGDVASVKTSYNTCRSENSGVLFSGFKTLPSYYPYSDGVLVHMNFYEDDPPASEPDEHIKKYTAVYFDREISEVQISGYSGDRNIDSAGDQTCELYLTFYISGNQGGTPITQSLFTYRMFME